MAKYSNRIRIYRSRSIAEFFVTHRKTARLKSKQHILTRISYVIHLDKVTTNIPGRTKEKKNTTKFTSVSRARSIRVQSIYISNEIAFHLLLFSQAIRRASIRVIQFFFFFFVQRNNFFFFLFSAFGCDFWVEGYLKRIRTHQMCIRD